MTKFGFTRSGTGEIFWRKTQRNETIAQLNDLEWQHLQVYPPCFEVSMNSKERLKTIYAWSFFAQCFHVWFVLLKLSIFRTLKRVKPFNPSEWLASNLSLQYHHWITHWCHENKRNDQQLKKLLIVWQILLVSTLVNVQKTIWRIWILMFGCKGLKNPDIVGHDVSWPMKT